MSFFSFCPAVPMRVLVAALLLSVLGLPSHAQTLWSRPYEPNQLSIEAIVPETTDEAAALSGATYITATLSLSDNVEFAAELPVAHFRPAAAEAGSATALGNPFVGLGLSSTTVPVLLQVGARLPVAPSNRATAIGETTDIGRTPAFHPEEFALSGLLNGRLELGRYSTLRLRTGVAFASRPSPGGPDRMQAWRFQYDAQLWREGDRFLTGVSLTGRTRLSRPGGTRYHAALSLMGNWTLVQPGLLVGTSLNDLFRQGVLRPFAGLTLSLSYGRL